MNRFVTRPLPAVAAFWIIWYAATVSHAEPVEVVIEFVRFDCSHCPVVFDRYTGSVSKQDQSAVNEAMHAVERWAVKRQIFRHSQWIECERRMRQTTQMHDCTLTLDVLLRSADEKLFTVQFDAKFARRREGERHANESRAATTLTCAMGETLVCGGFCTKSASLGNPRKLEISAFLLSIKKIDPSDQTEADTSSAQ